MREVMRFSPGLLAGTPDALASLYNTCMIALGIQERVALQRTLSLLVRQDSNPNTKAFTRLTMMGLVHTTCLVDICPGVSDKFAPCGDIPTIGLGPRSRSVVLPSFWHWRHAAAI